MLTHATLLLAFMARTAFSHSHCWIDGRAVDLTDELDFCASNGDADSGVCCTDAEEAAIEASYNAVGTLTTECAALYKQVECAMCGSFSAHLHERLDGLLTMTSSFCSSLTAACAGEIDFGSNYCDTRTGGGDDLFWSYPYEQGMMFEPGFTEVFPDLSDTDLPDSILAMHQTPGGDMYWISGKEGMIKQVYVDSLDSSSTVLDLSGGIFYDGSIEEGLLDFAFSPMFETNNYFYVCYNIDDGVVRNRLAKFVYVAGDAAATRLTEEVLMDSAERPEYLHNGGWLGFKPSVIGTNAAYHDLYWSVGDAGPQEDTNNHAQSTDILFGSMVRISVPSDGTGYTIPSGNYGGVLPEICAVGFRNHWRCGFDSATDDLYCGNVGHLNIESIYIVECGNNYGWARFEGTRCTEYSEALFGPCADADRSFLTPPTFEYCHYDYDSSSDSADYTGGNDLCGDRIVEGNSVIGGHVYRGSAFADLLYGAYIFAEYTGRNIFYLLPEGGGTWSPGTIVSDRSLAVVSFTELNNGELVVIGANNNIYYLPCGDVCIDIPATPAPQSGTPAPEAQTPTPLGQGGYDYLGCFADAWDRVLSGPSTMMSSSMTTEVCAGLCSGYAYFGTEFGQECFCGFSTDQPDSLGAGTCNSVCAGDPSDICGGRWSISVYEYTSS